MGVLGIRLNVMEQRRHILTDVKMSVYNNRKQQRLYVSTSGVGRLIATGFYGCAWEQKQPITYHVKKLCKNFYM